MSLRFGDKTRSGEPVAGFGQRASSGGNWVMTETVFNAPGTWTKPATVTQVEVIVVGGGGGGGFGGAPAPLGPQVAGGGGGGGVRTAIVPVSAPVPVTVGAGGAGGTPTTSAQVGGNSAFGPLGPGPIPAIPPTTIAVGGGGGGASYLAPELSLPAVPSIGGGGGGIGDATFYPVFSNAGTAGGRYGYSSATSSINTPARISIIGAGGAGDTNIGYLGGRGKLRYGFGAPSTVSISVYAPPYGGYPARTGPTTVGIIAATAGGTNTGNGGGAGVNSPPTATPAPLAPTIPAAQPGAAGGSGVVIVRHWSA